MADNGLLEDLDGLLSQLDAYPREICRGLLARIADFEREVSRLRSTYEDSSSRDAVRVLEVFAEYADYLKTYLQRVLGRPSPAHARQVADADEAIVRASAYLQLWFSESHGDIPVALIDSLRQALEEVGLRGRALLVTFGAPSQLETGNPDANRALKYFDAGENEPTFPPLSVFSIPKHEALSPLRWPVTLGHEVAHQYLRNLDIDDEGKPILRSELPSNFILRRLGLNPSNVERLAPNNTDDSVAKLFDYINNWVEEILCDVYLVHRYGPAGIAALGHFLVAVRATKKITSTHPPGWLRISLMLDYLDQTELPQELTYIVDPWREVAKEDRDFAGCGDSYAKLAKKFIEVNLHSIFNTIADIPVPRYDAATRIRAVLLAQRQISVGVPPHPDVGEHYLPGAAETVHGYSVSFDATAIEQPNDADILNAGWLVENAISTDVSRRVLPVDRLVMKALQNLHLVSPDEGAAPIFARAAMTEEISQSTHETVPFSGGGVLGRREILKRLVSEDFTKRLIITPLIDGSIDRASIDMRLGNGFIVFQRTGTASFSSVDRQNPRRVQRYLEKPWGTPFVLHPGEVVLASALEYVALPLDLCAQVITRSSYGRLGLITATAVQVHPGYRGCLTLELVNLGTVPLQLYPGERVAQLILLQAQVDSSAEDAGAYFHGTYRCPTSPEFPDIEIDEWVSALAAARSRP